MVIKKKTCKFTSSKNNQDENLFITKGQKTEIEIFNHVPKNFNKERHILEDVKNFSHNKKSHAMSKNIPNMRTNIFILKKQISKENFYFQFNPNKKSSFDKKKIYKKYFDSFLENNES